MFHKDSQLDNKSRDFAFCIRSIVSIIGLILIINYSNLQLHVFSNLTCDLSDATISNSTRKQQSQTSENNNFTI